MLVEKRFAAETGLSACLRNQCGKGLFRAADRREGSSKELGDWRWCTQSRSLGVVRLLERLKWVPSRNIQSRRSRQSGDDNDDIIAHFPNHPSLAGGDGSPSALLALRPSLSLRLV